LLKQSRRGHFTRDTQICLTRNRSVEWYRVISRQRISGSWVGLGCMVLRRASRGSFLSSGAIVNVPSMASKFAVPHLLPKVAARFALTGLSEGVQAELRSKDVRVTKACRHIMMTREKYTLNFAHRQKNRRYGSSFLRVRHLRWPALSTQPAKYLVRSIEAELRLRSLLWRRLP
jgi:NAD(P)-dependent dehydrogenase (short-subunit alcohol dehydrogenase family)